jgi:transcriptional regulator with XRE-family HTH domain
MAGEGGIDPAVVGARIKTLREGHHWEQIELARRAGLDKGTISRVEAGKRGLSARTLEKIARALDVSTDALMVVYSSPARVAPRGDHHRLQDLAVQAEQQLDPETRARLEGIIEGILLQAREQRRRD